jgi:DNA-binding transcriptional LysR family regulator
MQLSDRIGRQMKLHDLHVFLAVTQVGSMSRAAALLNTTQPAISRSIAELERTFGVRLLDRKPQGVEPTEFGRALLAGGAAVFDDLRKAVKDIEFLADPGSGEVRVGSPAPIAASFVSAVVDRLSRRYPRMTFHIADNEAEMRRALSERNLDLLVARQTGPHSDEAFGFEALYDDTFAIVAAAKSPWARRRRITLADLVKEPWVLPPSNSVIGSVAAEAFRAGGLGNPKMTVITVPREVRMSLLATGRFLTILPISALQFSPGHPKIKVLPVKLPISRGPIGIITAKNRALNPIATLFINAARETAKELTGKSRWKSA